jgi:putative ABC transport system permease protein
MTQVRQFLALLQMNLLSIPQRLGLVLTFALGVACAVGVLVSMLAMGVGARRQAMSSVRPDRVVLRSVGAQDATQSSIPRDQESLIRDLPGIMRDTQGRPITVSEAPGSIEARTKTDGSRIRLPFLGVTAGLAHLMPELHLTSGRMFRPGLREFSASSQCARQFSGFQIGDKRTIRGSDWLVVGHFDQRHAEGSCVVYADGDGTLSAFGRDSYNEIALMLQSPDAYSEFVTAVKANPKLHLDVKHESEVIEEEFKRFNAILDFASYFVGTIMALGATLGAANSLYAVVDARRREIATMRALGFGSGSIIVSVLSESVLLGIPSALLGSILAWVLFDGLSASPFGFAFRLSVTTHLAVIGTVWAMTMGLIAGLLPALRAATVPVAVALRTT